MNLKLLITFLLLGITQINFAQPGDIDNAFNFGGAGAKTYYRPAAPATPVLSNGEDANVYASDVYLDGSVHSDKIIIVGRFENFNGVDKMYIARLNADGTLDNTFTGPVFADNQYIYCVKILANDKIIISGGFRTGIYQSIARLNEDGSLDTTFNSLPSGERGFSSGAIVHAIEIQADNKILVGGLFNKYGSTNCKNLVRLNTDGTLDSSFYIPTANNTFINGQIRAIAMQGTKIIVGGFFSKFGTVNQNLIMRLNSDGTYDNTFNNVTDNTSKGLKYVGTPNPFGNASVAVFDIVVLPYSPLPGSLSEYIYVAGKFDQYNGLPVNKSFMRLTKDGFIDSSFNKTYFLGNPNDSGITSTESSTAGRTVFALQLQPDAKILIGGNFTKYNNVTLPKGLARLNLDGSVDTNFLTGLGFTGGTNVFEGKSVVRNIILQSDGKIVAGGDFTKYDITDKRMIVRIKTRECTQSTRWNGGIWYDGVPTSDSYAVILENKICTVPTGTHWVTCELEIQSGAKIVIQPGASLTVKGVIMNNGTFEINNNGSLIQIKDDAANTDLGAGTFSFKRSTTPIRRLDYTYWSSPVEKQKIIYVSPNTLIDKFYNYNSQTDAWSLITNLFDPMTEGQGYIIRAPQNYSLTVPAIYTAEFKGRPNNGIITVPVYTNSGSSMNLLGNPYPSSVDANMFLDDAANSTTLDGTLYFWTHKSSPVPNGTGASVYTNADYLVYNRTGGTITSPNGEPFDGQIAAGQGFFVKAIATGSAKFNNTMRNSTQNSQFFRNASASQISIEPSKNRMWLDLSDATGTFSQMLLGYIDGATNEYDRSFDGEVLSGNTVGLYSFIDNKNFTIQGRALPFNQQEIVPIGFKAAAAGTFELKLSNFDGLFTDQNVYLVDRELNIIHDLKASSYTFNSASGTFNNRFEIQYTNDSLLSSQTFDAGKDVNVFTGNSVISIASNNENISEVQVFDLIGKLLHSNSKIGTKTSDIHTIIPANQILMVKIKLENNAETVKKIIF